MPLAARRLTLNSHGLPRSLGFAYGWPAFIGDVPTINGHHDAYSDRSLFLCFSLLDSTARIDCWPDGRHRVFAQTATISMPFVAHVGFFSTDGFILPRRRRF